jgi:hypothetical protein
MRQLSSHYAGCTVAEDGTAALYVAARKSILPPDMETKTSILIEEDLKWNPIPQ